MLLLHVHEVEVTVLEYTARWSLGEQQIITQNGYFIANVAIMRSLVPISIAVAEHSDTDRLSHGYWQRVEKQTWSLTFVGKTCCLTLPQRVCYFRPSFLTT